ncbi:MAG: flagellin [Fusobacteriia bacterium 4572_132]|nr:MAG: flagellin [Fusobacteriia bacterium 4572_132]
MIINHNISATNSYRNFTNTNKDINSSLEKLSSGLRINRAGDDAAGLAISEKMRGQIKGLDMASKNAQDSISLIQTAEGALNETHSILQRMRELSVQSANDTNTTSDRAQLQQEVGQLLSEINRIGETTQFNGKNLLSGAFSTNGLTFHVGANNAQVVTLKIDSMRASALSVSNVSVSSQTGAESAITTVDAAIITVSTQRSKFGAMQNRLEHTINNLSTSAENLQAAESRIRDVDMAKEMVNYSKSSIISQVGTSMLAQANIRPQGVIELFR